MTHATALVLVVYRPRDDWNCRIANLCLEEIQDWPHITLHQLIE